MPAGRPTKYNQKLVTVICERIANGESLRKICQDDDMPNKNNVRLWLKKYKEFRAQYARARDEQADFYAEEIIEIADDSSNDTKKITKGDKEIEVVSHENVNRSKLRVDARKWIASKLKPKKYGDRVEHDLGESAVDALGKLMGEIQEAGPPKPAGDTE